MRALVFSTACTLALAAPLRPPGYDAPAPDAPAPRLSEFYDPRLMAQNMCGGSQGPRLSPIVQAAAAAAPADSGTARSPRIEGLGPLTYKITTPSPDAQAFFDQGLKLFYAFNPGEAVASFRAAADADPSCAMCAWGEALTLGPNLNGPMLADNNPAALAAVARAKDLSAKASPREQALINAVAARYSADKKVTRDDLDIAYADAMTNVHAAYVDDPEIAAIYAEAAMNVRSDPWGRWWDTTGRHPTGYLAGAIPALEAVLKAHPEHPGAIHLYIHALDNSVYPEKVIPYAEKLAGLMPNAGHMVHMPAHTFFNVGRYTDALATNVSAIAVDDAYLKGQAAATAVYRYGLYQHNVHFAIVAADMAGDETAALRLAKLMTDFQSANTVARGEVSEAAAIHAAVRFRTPEDMLALPRPDKKFNYLTGIWHYARGTGYAAQTDPRRALAEADAIDKLRTGKKPAVTGLLANLLGVAAEVVRGRADAGQGKWSDAAAHFKTAIDFQDKVQVRDPPFWDFPVRELRGVALFKAGKTQQAAEVLRQALLEAPNSGYGLYALAQVSTALGDATAAAEYQKLFAKAWVGAKPPSLERL